MTRQGSSQPVAFGLASLLTVPAGYEMLLEQCGAAKGRQHDQYGIGVVEEFDALAVVLGIPGVQSPGAAVKELQMAFLFGPGKTLSQRWKASLAEEEGLEAGLPRFAPLCTVDLLQCSLVYFVEVRSSIGFFGLVEKRPSVDAAYFVLEVCNNALGPAEAVFTLLIRPNEVEVFQLELRFPGRISVHLQLPPQMAPYQVRHVLVSVDWLRFGLSVAVVWKVWAAMTRDTVVPPPQTISKISSSVSSPTRWNGTSRFARTRNSPI
ncbi:hypothetical protein MCOR21_003690 [Pyricularia oryzae]|nr:hypothetical protein MCOR30_004894 [Pyricularia oryzae]KAI6356302.1 hypothetical protein MCOR32_009987 [Pyricularia oryzae]KAI6431946.1 hypothetical protein MCOR21_003690 [Pyricularia oryzae]KAI6538693.1 hypothetical protein MCOR05_004854 [Pyricularia oryzae]